MEKKSFIFIIICCCLLTVPVILSGPAGALQSETVGITGNIPLVTYNVSVTGIDWTNAIVTWNTNENANSTVEYGTTTSYGSLSTDGIMAEDHTISLYSLSPGTVYHYQVISVDLAGNSAVSTDSTFTTTAITPVTVIPTTPTSAPIFLPYAGGSGGGGGGGGGKPPSGVPVALPAQVGPPESKQISETYDLTSQGVSVSTNQQGQQTLSIDLTTAKKTGATVVVSDKSVDITQPGFTLNIVAEHVEEKNGVVKGDNIQSISLSTTPLEASFPEVGTVAASVQAGLTSLPQGASITTTISEKATPEAQSAFQVAVANSGKDIQAVAYTMSITKTNIQATLPAIIRMSAPQDWVNNNGGINAVSIVRYGDDKSVSVLETSYVGNDEKGNMVFEAKSPAGLSIFGLLTAKATAAKQQEGVSVQPLQKPAILTEMGMFGWISTLLIQNPIVLVILTCLLIVSVYFGWWKRRI